MLLSFCVENWRAFKEQSCLSLRATRERTDAETLAIADKTYGVSRILPLASIYGPNASGKTSILEGLSFVRHLVVDGTHVNQMTGVDPYRLDDECKKAPSRFIVEILIGSLVYVYELAITRSDVVSEKLHVVRSRSNQLVFSREFGNIEFGGAYKNTRHELIFENTRDNQLFLHNAIAQNAIAFAPVYNWFRYSLIVVGVDAKYERYSQMLLRPDFNDFVNRKLRRYLTGVNEIVPSAVSIDALPFPRELVDDFVRSVEPGGAADLQVRLMPDYGSGPEIYIVHYEDGEEPSAYKVKVQHRSNSGKTALFELNEESSGTQHLIELLPIFFDMAALQNELGHPERVYLVDELDKSFHSALTIDLVKEYLKTCNNETRHQLIFTTHDLMLMEAECLRKDEMWFCEKDRGGEAQLKALSAQDGVRTDMDVLNKYKKGLVGGYPKFVNA